VKLVGDLEFVMGASLVGKLASFAAVVSELSLVALMVGWSELVPAAL